MKKVISILLVLCVAVSLFAVGSVKVGGAFNFVTGATRDFYLEDTKVRDGSTYKSNGFGFDVAGDFDVAKDLAVWADFNMVFGSDAKLEDDSLDDSYKNLREDLGDNADKAYKKINMISFGAGVAYKLALDPVDVKLGGGLFLNRVFGKVGYSDASIAFFDEVVATAAYSQFKAINFGIALLADASYKFNKNFGVDFKLMPQIGLYNSSTTTLSITVDDVETKTEYKAKGFKLSYAMPIVVGVSYSF